MTMLQDSETKPKIIYSFDEHVQPNGWIIVNDGVMGGLSKGEMDMNEEGNGVFRGRVSLENNGGFSLARLSLDSVGVQGYDKVVLNVKGDGKRYQFRLKNDKHQMHSYVKFFQTTGEWEKIEIYFSDLTPTFRGRILNLPKFSSDTIEEIGILIGNKKEEDFSIQINSITLE